MALLFIDSFDHYATADITEKWTASSFSSIVAGAGRRGSSGSRGGSINRWTQRGINPGSSTLIVGYAVKSTNLTVSAYTCQLGENSAQHIGVWIGVDGALGVSRMGGSGWQTSGAAVLASSVAGLLAINVYAHVQLKVTIGDSPTGSVELRLNGVTVASASGVDTRNGGLGAVNSVYIGGETDIDDFWICDSTGAAPWNDFLGDCRVDARYPTAEGANSAWTPLSGTDNALMVDETAPDDNTTYNSTGTIGAVDTHVVEDAPVVGATIYGVQHCISMQKTDAGVCQVAPVIRHGSTDYVGVAIAPSTAYAYGLQVAQVNPGTSAQWTESGFNAAEFGYKRTA